MTKYGSLPQYSTEICEASHKPLKDAYRTMNHINIMSQILKTYTRNHNVAMRDNNFAQCMQELQDLLEDSYGILRSTPPIIRVPPGAPASTLHLKLQGRIDTKKVFNLQTLAALYQLPDLQALNTSYLIDNAHQRKPKRHPIASRASDGLDAWDVFSVNMTQLQGALPSGMPYLCACPPRMQVLL